ncbi:endonuclease domain-containing protein [Streptomyces roseolus]|uniref:endonuclease domain-containing protein n=1 Tax=Streptomyces roseolus TaxID=67358 RepID=UPI003790C636
MINDLGLGVPRPAPKLPPAVRRTDYGHRRRPDLACPHDLYRLTCDDYEAMRDRARDCCEICGLHGHDTPRGALVVDHFEGGGARFVRGLLCDRCNSLMQRHDGTAPWGPKSLHRSGEARAYHLNAFSNPTDEQRARADAEITRRRKRLQDRYVVSSQPVEGGAL